MFEELIDRAWNCFDKSAAKRQPRAPPDKLANASPPLVLRKHEVIAGLMTLDPRDLPDQQRLDDEFQNLLDELDLGPQKSRELREQSAEKKWLMVMEQRQRKQNPALLHSGLDCTLDHLREWNRHFPDHYSRPLAVQQLEALAIALRTESSSFVHRFLEHDGVTLLAAFLEKSRLIAAESLALPILSCFKALLNSSAGRSRVLESPETLLNIAAAIDLTNPRCQLFALEILSGLCLAVSGGPCAVLRAFSDARHVLGERTRFQTLVQQLNREHGTPRDTERVRVALMSLLNALLKTGGAESSLEFRMHLRYELLMLGLPEVIRRVRGQHGPTLEDHLDLFEMMRTEDEQELQTSLDSPSLPRSTETNAGNVECGEVATVVEQLRARLARSAAQPHLHSLLHHLTLVPGDERHLPLWRLFDLILQQLVLKAALRDAPDPADLDPALEPTIRFELDDLLARLRTDANAARLEHELHGVKEELDQEKKRVMELENRLSDIQDGISLSSFSRTSDHSSTPSDPRHSPTPTLCSLNAIPPIKPPSSVPPPPPPPPFGGVSVLAQTPKKRVPKPLRMLKTLNWTKISAEKCKGTVWENVNDENLYDQLDLNTLSHQFAAGAKDSSDMAGTVPRRLFKQETVPSVIEPRRAQNCTIMLSKLKLSHREIRLALMSMDEKGKLPKDMIEQMLKYIPTKEEQMAIAETVTKHRSAAILPFADRFLFEVSQIPRYEQRLQCLHIMRGFQERVDELLPYLNAVCKASTTVSGSKRLKQLLVLLLAIGNYLNFGKRTGNAPGFTLASLAQVANVRSALKADRNLLHYVASLVEEKFPDLLRMKRELCCVFDATKYRKEELDQEIRTLQTALRFVAREEQNHQQVQVKQRDERTANNNNMVNEDNKNVKGKPDPADDSVVEADDSGVKTSPAQATARAKAPNDRFVAAISAFLKDANHTMRGMETLAEDTQNKFASCALFFAEDPAHSSPDEFFGTLAKFLNQFNDCYAVVLKEREEADRVKRQTITRGILSKKVNGRKLHPDSGHKDFERLVDALQTGELFSEELNRLRTSIRLPRTKKSSTKT